MIRPALDYKRIATIKARATAELKKHGCQAPVDLNLIIKGEDELDLCPGNYGDKFEGALDYDQNTGKFDILINTVFADKDANRARFTLAHELGHYFIKEHAIALLDGGVLRYEFPATIKKGQLPDELQTELEADCFASHLLVPEKALQDLLDQEQKADRKLSHHTVKQVARHFRVSYQCAGGRVVSQANCPCALAVYPAVPGRIPWLEVSDSFENKFRISRNSRLKPLHAKSGDTCEQLDNWIEGVRIAQKNQLANITVVNGGHATSVFIVPWPDDQI